MVVTRGAPQASKYSRNGWTGVLSGIPFAARTNCDSEILRGPFRFPIVPRSVEPGGQMRLVALPR